MLAVEESARIHSQPILMAIACHLGPNDFSHLSLQKTFESSISFSLVFLKLALVFYHHDLRTDYLAQTSSNLIYFAPQSLVLHSLYTMFQVLLSVIEQVGFVAKVYPSSAPLLSHMSSFLYV